MSAAIANCGEPIARDSRLIMNDRDFSPNESIKEGRFADVRPTDDRYTLHANKMSILGMAVTRLKLVGSRVGMSLCLQLPYALHHINDPGHEREKSSDRDDDDQR